MQRREIMKFLGGAAAWPLGAHAQQPTMPVVGFLNAASPNLFAHVVRAFHLGLSETGYVEGRNVAVEYRWADNQYERLPALAAELVRHRVKVIATGSATLAGLAAKEATTTIPIVFLTGSDPVQVGLVGSLNRPGGNVTGVTTMNVEMTPKRLQVLRELLPMTSTMAVLVNPINISLSIQTIAKQVQAVAPSLGLQMVPVLEASTAPELDSAFSSLVQQGAGGLVISADTFFSGKSQELAQLALRNAIPAISPYREFVVAG